MDQLSEGDMSSFSLLFANPESPNYTSLSMYCVCVPENETQTINLLRSQGTEHKSNVKKILAERFYPRLDLCSGKQLIFPKRLVDWWPPGQRSGTSCSGHGGRSPAVDRVSVQAGALAGPFGDSVN